MILKIKYKRTVIIIIHNTTPERKKQLNIKNVYIEEDQNEKETWK